MALRTAGLILIAKGAQQYISDISRAAKAEENLMKTTQKAAEQMSKALQKMADDQRKASEAAARAEINRDKASLRHNQALANLINTMNDEKATTYEVIMAESEERITGMELALSRDVFTRATDEAIIANNQYADSLANSAAANQAAAAASANAGVARGGLAGLGGVLGGPAGMAIGAVGGIIAADVASKGLIGTLASMVAHATHVDVLFKILGADLSMAAGVFNFLVNAVKFSVNALESLIGVLIRVGSTIAGVVVNSIKGLVGMLTGLVDKLVSPFVNFAKQVVSIFAGISLWNVIQKTTQALSEMSAQIVTALSDLQRLNIQFQSLVARDIANSMMIPFTQAMGAAIPVAKELFNWIRDLAVVTPFTVIDISQSVAMANAMGLNVERAKALTHAVGNFAAGMGLTSDHMYRIIYNMGQMVSMGKLTGREFRDLANSFVPVYQILDELRVGTGKSREEFRKFAMEGGVDVKTFIDKFIEVSERNFPNAMQRMARTFEGVKNNIKDFLEVVLGFEVFGPVFDRITGMMADGLDKLLSPAIRTTADIIGRTLLLAFDKLVEVWRGQVIPALQTLAHALGLPDWSKLDASQIVTRLAAGLVAGVEKIAAFIKRLGESFSLNWDQIATNAFTWGHNIIVSFANGMVNGLVAVVNAIARLVNYITSMLQAFSPPKALPDLTKWGAAAVAAYMEGWKQIDYKLFQDMASTIEGFLRALGKNVIPEKQLVPLIQGMRKAVADLVEQVRKTGDASADMIDRVMKAAKKLPANFKDYIKSLIDVEKATYAVNKAQKAVDDQQKKVKSEQDVLNAVTDKYSKILDELNKQLSRNQEVFDDNARLAEINAAINTGLLTAEEKARLEVEKRDLMLKAQIRTVEDQRDAEVGAQQAKVDAAQSALDLLDAQLDAAKAQLDIANENLDAQKSLIDIQSDNAKLIQEQIDLLKSLADAAKGAGSAVNDATDSLLDMQGEYNSTLVAIDAWSKHQFDTQGEIKSNWEKTLSETETNIDNFFKNITSKVNTAKVDLGKLFEPLVGPGGALAMLKVEFEKLGRAIFGGFTQGPGGEPMKTVGIFEKLQQLGKDIADAWRPFGEIIADIAGNYVLFADAVLKLLGINLQVPTVEGVSDFFGLVGGILKWSGKIIELLTGLTAKVVAVFAVWVQNSITSPLGIITLFIGLAEAVFSEFMDFLVGHSLIQELGDKINTVLNEKLTIVVATIGTQVDAMIAVFVDHEGEFYLAGSADITSVSQGMDDAMTGLLSKIDPWVAQIYNTFESRSNLALFYDIGKSMVEGIAYGLGDGQAWATLYNAIVRVVQKVIKAAKDEAETASPSRKTMEIGRNIGMGLAIGIRQSADAIQSSIRSAVGAMNVQASMIGSRMVNSPVVSSPAVTNSSSIDRSVHIEVNPSYSNYQSAASVYYDVSAALAAAGR